MNNPSIEEWRIELQKFLEKQEYSDDYIKRGMNLPSSIYVDTDDLGDLIKSILEREIKWILKDLEVTEQDITHMKKQIEWEDCPHCANIINILTRLSKLK